MRRSHRTTSFQRVCSGNKTWRGIFIFQASPAALSQTSDSTPTPSPSPGPSPEVLHGRMDEVTPASIQPCLRQDRTRVVVSAFEENLDKAAFKDPRDYAVANALGKAREVRHVVTRRLCFPHSPVPSPAPG